MLQQACFCIKLVLSHSLYLHYGTGGTLGTRTLEPKMGLWLIRKGPDAKR